MISRRGSAAAIVLSVVGAAGFLILPVILGAASTKHALSAQQTGQLAAMLMSGSVISAISALFWVRSVNWRTAARLALVLEAAGIAGATFQSSVPPLGVALMLAGFGGGAVYSLALTVLSDHARSETLFGYSITGQVAFQVIGMLLLSFFLQPGGFDNLMLALLVLVVVAFVLTQFLPVRGAPTPPLSISGIHRNPKALLALFGCLFFFVNVGAVWAYIERIGQSTGMSANAIGLSLAIGVSVGMLGALAASRQAARFGRLKPLVAGTLGTVLALVFMRDNVSAVVFVIAVGLYNFVWNYSLTYQYAVVAAADPSGRFVAIAPAFHAIGAALGPALAALLVTAGGTLAVNAIAAAAVIVSLMLFIGPAKLP